MGVPGSSMEFLGVYTFPETNIGLAYLWDSLGFP